MAEPARKQRRRAVFDRGRRAQGYGLGVFGSGEPHVHPKGSGFPSEAREILESLSKKVAARG